MAVLTYALKYGFGSLVIAGVGALVLYTVPGTLAAAVVGLLGLFANAALLFSLVWDLVEEHPSVVDRGSY